MLAAVIAAISVVSALNNQWVVHGIMDALLLFVALDFYLKLAALLTAYTRPLNY
jgi:hypothetical protein